MPITRRLTPITLVILILLTGCALAAPTPTVEPSPSPTADPPSSTPSPTAALTPTASPTPTPASAAERITDAHGVDMIYIPAGDFTMGSNQGFSDELPVHTVTLDAYYVDRVEVTNQQYQACLEAGACAPPFRSDCCTNTATVSRPDYFGNPEYAQYPVIWLNWVQAGAFCTWRGARLPTEAEWEKAARGTDARLYPWGNQAPTPNRLNFTWQPGEFDIQPVFNTSETGSYLLGASPYGVLDMAGNVYEWVSDIYSAGYYAISPVVNPTGPKEGRYRIARGGSFFNQAFRNRSSNRNPDAFLLPDASEFDAGARCAFSP